MQYITTYLNALLELVKDLLPWFVLGLLIAAIIQEFVPTKKLLKHFKENKIKNILKATFVGLFISVCSCGAIPIVAMLRKKGASTATALTMLLATPWAGFLHILLLSKFLGWTNTILLFTCSILIAFFSGLILARLENKDLLEQRVKHKHKENEPCTECLIKQGIKRQSLSHRVLFNIPKEMYHILKDIGKFILIGVLLAAVLKAFIPTEIIAKFLGSSMGTFLPILITLPAATVIELCSEGFTVLAGQLYEMGATLGVVLTIMMVGVATDITELSMLWGKFGKRSTIAYVVISVLLIVLVAFLLNLFI